VLAGHLLSPRSVGEFAALRDGEGFLGAEDKQVSDAYGKSKHLVSRVPIPHRYTPPISANCMLQYSPIALAIAGSGDNRGQQVTALARGRTPQRKKSIVVVVSY
jgi:hypothetical protein